MGGVLAAALTKLNLRSRELSGLSHKFTVECMLIVAYILKLGKESQAVHPIDADSGTQLSLQILIEEEILACTLALHLLDAD